MAWSLAAPSMLLADAASPRGGLPFLTRADFTPTWSSDEEVARVSEFRLVDHGGKPLSHAAMQGHPSVVNFFFATCHGICPTMMSRMQEVQRKLSAVEGMRIYSITITPNSDTPEKLREYARGRKIDLRNWSLVTGDQDELYRLARQDFKADKQVKETGSGASFLHSENVYLLDSQRRIRGIYNSRDPASLALLATDAADLARER